jgi:hypothetical protein
LSIAMAGGPHVDVTELDISPRRRAKGSRIRWAEHGIINALPYSRNRWPCEEPKTYPRSTAADGVLVPPGPRGGASIARRSTTNDVVHARHWASAFAALD